MNVNRLFSFLAIALIFIAQTLNAQQNDSENKVISELRAKAEQGDAKAQNGLGEAFLRNKFGLATNPVEALKWFRKAADQDLPKAKYNLGLCYLMGRGVETNTTEAATWFRKAAEQDFGGAQANLGLCYMRGEGVEKDQAKAIMWWRKAVEHDDAHAQCNLGLCYMRGDGVQRDPVEAIKLWTMAANLNDAQSQSNLGQCYRRGDGVAKDYVESYKWTLLSAGQGFPPARKEMPNLESLLTQEQIAEGQKLARNFRPRVPSPQADNTSSTPTVQTHPRLFGSGFFITDDGYLITSEHVIDKATQIRLVTSAGSISAKLIKVDLPNDLALLKAEGKFSALPVATSRAVKLGGTVITVGFPNVPLQGFSPKLAKGEIASLSGMGDDARLFQISVPVQPGNSGGSLVNDNGNVVGVVWGKLSARATLATSGSLPENVNYAVKSSFLLGFLESIPQVSAKLKKTNSKKQVFEDVVKSAEQAAALVLGY